MDWPNRVVSVLSVACVEQSNGPEEAGGTGFLFPCFQNPDIARAIRGIDGVDLVQISPAKDFFLRKR